MEFGFNVEKVMGQFARNSQDSVSIIHGDQLKQL